ncbi:hypothetical protein DKX38_015831 [Salix brachista]|uniref:Uncharacterized protein n=1 Tax=Salix brachista TaxID=2182728 RepID=A0A5N5L6Z2_9ROSI|nr:hypothetical protein DKX38_015831 [Salix brachista]
MMRLLCTLSTSRNNEKNLDEIEFLGHLLPHHSWLATCMLLTMPGADARAPVRCPRMIDCGSVCQGFPYKCVDGKCICGGEVFPRPPASIRQ